MEVRSFYSRVLFPAMNVIFGIFVPTKISGYPRLCLGIPVSFHKNEKHENDSYVVPRTIVV
jgi:hypothetical protein